MTNDDYKALLAKIIAEPDTAQDTATAIMKEIEADAKTASDFQETAKKDAEDKDAKIKDLEAQVNHYKAQEFLGTMGQQSKPFDPIQNAVDIASTIINPIKPKEN